METLTQERSKEIWNYNTKTGIITWAIEPCDKMKKGSEAGCINRRGYIQIRFNNKQYSAHRIAWLYVYGYFPEYGIDHINRIKTDNRIANLREVSQQCNSRNTGNYKTNTSGVKGVCWHKINKRWCSFIKKDNGLINLGTYKDFDNAVCARLAAEQGLGWPGCDSSSPAFKYVQNMLTTGGLGR